MNRKNQNTKVLIKSRQRKRTNINALRRNNMKNKREIIIDNYIRVRHCKEPSCKTERQRKRN